jgi:hypothetical protein
MIWPKIILLSSLHCIFKDLTCRYQSGCHPALSVLDRISVVLHELLKDRTTSGPAERLESVAVISVGTITQNATIPISGTYLI